MRHLFFGLIVVFATAPASHQQPPSTTQPSQPARVLRLLSLSEMKWSLGPAAFPPGAQMMLLVGDLAKPGLFTLRVKMPDGFRIPSHRHAADEYVTILQGTFVVGLGQEADQGAIRELVAGSFATFPAGTWHFARTEGETVIQIHGAAPWVVTYGDSNEDPRRKRQVVPIR